MSRWISCASLLLVTAFAGICFCDEPNVEKHAIVGRVVDENSVGVAGVQVSGFLYHQTLVAKTAEDGSFSLDLSPDRTPAMAVVADDVEGDRMAIHRLRSDSGAAEEIRLQPVRRIAVSVVDPEGAPAAGVEIGAFSGFVRAKSEITNDEGKAELRVPAGEPLTLYAWKPDVGFDYRHLADPAQNPSPADPDAVSFELSAGPPLKFRLVDEAQNPIVGIELRPWLVKRPEAEEDFNFSFAPRLFSVKTDEQGIVEFRGLPNWGASSLTFWPYSKVFEHRAIMVRSAVRTDAPVTAQLYRRVAASGRVTFPDGRPAANTKVVAVGKGYGFAIDRTAVSADADGRFQMLLAPEMLYVLGIQEERWAAPAIDGVVPRVGQSIDELDFQLRSPTRVYGAVTLGREKAAVVGLSVSLRQRTRALTELEDVKLERRMAAVTETIRPSLELQMQTDEQGRFEFFVGPGTYELQASGIRSKTIEVKNEVELRVEVGAPR